MPGFGGVLAAELFSAIGDISRSATAGRLAVASGMAPVSRDSGSNTGNRLRPTPYSRPLQRAFLPIKSLKRHRAVAKRYELAVRYEATVLVAVLNE
ncbi:MULTISPECIES: transposase [Streptomyces]|uniref:transposase n=1 Tax=Streptomyces TaxID=1883 RepID=UPI0033E5031D